MITDDPDFPKGMEYVLNNLGMLISCRVTHAYDDPDGERIIVFVHLESGELFRRMKAGLHKDGKSMPKLSTGGKH